MSLAIANGFQLLPSGLGDSGPLAARRADVQAHLVARRWPG